MATWSWRRGSESNEVFTDGQPQYPDLQGHFNFDSKGLQAVSGTTRHLPALTRHAPGACSVIEEIVEGFVEGFCMGMHQTLIRSHDGSYWRSETGTDLKLRVTPHSEGMPDRVVWLQC